MMTLQEISPAELVAAIEANMAEFWRCFGRLPGAVMHDEPDLLWFATGVPDGSLNGVIHSQFADGEAASRIDETVEYFERRRLPMQWWVGPSSRPAGLGELLEARGLASRPWRPPGMAVDLGALSRLETPAGLTVHRVRDEATVKSWLAASGAQTEALATSRDRAGRADAPLRRAAGGGAGGRFIAYAGGRRGEPAACGDGAGGAPAGRWDRRCRWRRWWTRGHWATGSGSWRRRPWVSGCTTGLGSGSTSGGRCTRPV